MEIWGFGDIWKERFSIPSYMYFFFMQARYRYSPCDVYIFRRLRSDHEPLNLWRPTLACICCTPLLGHHLPLYTRGKTPHAQRIGSDMLSALTLRQRDIGGRLYWDPEIDISSSRGVACVYMCICPAEYRGGPGAARQTLWIAWRDGVFDFGDV
ncbi:hypothetical protein BDD12DRAFT_560471 [Trichophaea hybrida]|nr:hypothetical protein BDD12DRAFT_560471 [Trichophaea hybrida]